MTIPNELGGEEVSLYTGSPGDDFQSHRIHCTSVLFWLHIPLVSTAPILARTVVLLLKCPSARGQGSGRAQTSLTFYPLKQHSYPWKLNNIIIIIIKNNQNNISSSSKKIQQFQKKIKMTPVWERNKKKNTHKKNSSALQNEPQDLTDKSK